MLFSSFSSLRKERTMLQQVKNNMAADLERLLNHREELAVMKQVLISLQSGQNEDVGGSGRGVHRTKALSRTEDESPHKPKPTVFTKKEPPGWYAKAKQKPK